MESGCATSRAPMTWKSFLDPKVFHQLSVSCGLRISRTNQTPDSIQKVVVGYFLVNFDLFIIVSDRVCMRASLALLSAFSTLLA